MAGSAPSWAIPTEDDVPDWAIPSGATEQRPGTLPSLLPSFTGIEDERVQAQQPVGFAEGSLAISSDLVNTPSRAAATMRGQEMTDADAYYFRPEVEKDKARIDALLPESAPFTRGVLKFADELRGRTVSDPMTYLGVPSEGVRFVGQKVARAGEKFAGAAKRGIESLSQFPQSLLDRAASPKGAQELRDAAIRSEGGNLYPMAEDLAQKVQGVNEARQGLQAGTEGRQVSQFEEGLTEALNRPGVLLGTPSRGTNITETVDRAKTPMQEAFIAGDKESVGPLRGEPPTEEVFETRTPIMGKGPQGTSGLVQVGEDVKETRVKDVSNGIKNVLREFKALSPDQGVPKITKGASGAIKSILGMADRQANTIDDLVNLKGQLRSVRNSGGYEGNIFDSSVDDLAFAKSEEVINRSIEKAIAKADPKNASKIIQLMRANNEQYAKTKELLSGLAGGMGRIENSDRVISKVAALGPQRSRELIQASERIPALKPVVDELRQGFIDDLILSASKGGSVDPASFAKRWNDTRTLSPELKSAWLTPEQVSRINEAVRVSMLETGKPGLVGEKLFGSASKPSLTGGARRLENIGAAANRDAAKELEFLDNILGLKGEDSYLKQATDVFEGRQLGITKDGNLPVTPVSRTGRSVLGTALGDVIGGVLGGTVGLVAGGLSGAATGAVLGAGTKRGLQVGMAYAQSPAGAVAANRLLNKWAIQKAEGISARAGAIARSLEKSKSPVLKARLVDQLKREIEKHTKDDK